jgi:hypothetical protein
MLVLVHPILLMFSWYLLVVVVRLLALVVLVVPQRLFQVALLLVEVRYP